MKYSAIILAAGSGKRMGLNYNKILHEINGKKVLDYSVDFFLKDKKCNQIILVSSDSDFNILFHEYHKKVDCVVVGGETRQESVFKGLIKAVSDFVLIHDSARPFIVKDKVDQLCTNVLETKASTLAVFVKDTIVNISGNRLTKALDRSKLVALQTPQAFETKIILEAHKKAIKTGYLATDDTKLVSKFTSIIPSFVEGDYRSIKLTTRDDINLLKVIL